MKRITALIFTLLLALFLFCACGKEAAPSEEPAVSTTSAATTAATAAAETSAATEASIPETVPATESVSSTNIIVIDSDTYTLPIHAKDLMNNGWELEDPYAELDSEGEMKAINFIRNGLTLSIDLTGTPGGSIYDEDVILSTIACRSSEDNAPATLADSLFPGMAYENLISTMESLGYEDIEAFGTAHDGDVVIAFHDDYMLEIHSSDGIVNTLIIVMT